ncbi:MAG: hypothetical protein OQJ89_06530 [Kangiellaceae bacterium]|nr:hypothetical protein [Kangiellaceae bacterium]MCW9016599.1 hypothetical protein [Kangiellaceae bacterium]
MNKVKFIGLALILILQACSSIKHQGTDCSRIKKNVAPCEQSNLDKQPAHSEFVENWAKHTEKERRIRVDQNKVETEKDKEKDIQNGFFHTLIDAISSIFKD